MFEESTSLLVAAGPESTSRLRSTTQLRRGGPQPQEQEAPREQEGEEEAPGFGAIFRPDA